MDMKQTLAAFLASIIAACAPLARGQLPEDGMGITITGITVDGPDVILEWDDLSSHPDAAIMDEVFLYSRESFSAGDWGVETGVAKDSTGATVAADAPSKFFQLVATLVRNVLVSFKANHPGAENPGDMPVTVGDAYGAGEVLPVVARAGGFTFDGWFTAEEDGALVTDATLVTTTSNHDLWAQWNPNPVDWQSNPLVIVVTNSASAMAFFSIPDATGVDVTFDPYAAVDLPDGFYFDAATRRVTVGTSVMPDDYAFAVSATPSNELPLSDLNVSVTVKRQATVFFDAGIGSASFASKPVVTGEAYGGLATASATDWAFCGWWTDPTGGVETTGGTTVTATADHTLYARWAQLPAPANAIFENDIARAVTAPVANVSPAGAALTFINYGLMSFPASGVASATLPAGVSHYGGYWEITFNPATRQISVPAGTTAHRFRFYGTAQVSGTTYAQTIASPSFTVEVRERQTYWANQIQPSSTQEFNNPNNMFKTAPADTPYAYRDLTNALAQDRVTYPQRAGIGNEQPGHAVSLSTSTSIRSWRSRNTSNNNNLLHCFTQTLNGGSRADTTVMYNNATNPDGTNNGTITANIAPVVRGGTIVWSFRATNSNIAGTNFRIMWMNATVLWAPPQNGGITY